MTTIHERIRARRKQAGMTQADVAKLVGVSRVSLTQWELGDTSPNGENLMGLCRALKCSPEWLQSGTGNPDIDAATTSDYLPVTVWDAPEDLDPEQSVIVPRVDVRFAAGNGREASFEPTNKDQGNAYRMEWIRARQVRAFSCPEHPSLQFFPVISGQCVAFPTFPIDSKCR